MRIITRRDTGLLTQWRFGSSVYDVATIDFVNATGITDATTINAINTLVVYLKLNLLWDKLYAIYPFIGSTASSQKWNLKDPRDSNLAFRLSFVGGWTHSSTGALPNGTNGYADTFINILNALPLFSHSFGVYSRTNDTTGIKVYGSYNGVVFFQNNFTSASFISGVNASAINYTANPTTSLLMGSRTANNLFTGYRAGVSVGTNTTVVTAIPSLNFYLGARNDSLTPILFSNHQIAFAFLGEGFNGTESGNLYTGVQAFQTSMSRQI